MFFHFAAFFLQHHPAASQNTSKTLAFTNITINDGLSQGMVIRVLQDKYGFMWFATLDGLNRYDGYKFTVYRHDARQPTSITESFVHSMFEDSRGRLWLGTISGGLDLFDRENETFIHIKHIEGSTGSLSNGPVQSIAEDKAGNIWVNVGNKVDKIIFHQKENSKPEKFSIHHVKLPVDYKSSIVSITQSGTIYYINAIDGVMYQLSDDKAETWKVVLDLEDYLPHQHKKNWSRYRITQLLEDTAHASFYVLHEAGVTRFNEKTGVAERIYRNEFFNHRDGPMSASIDLSGIIWFPQFSALSLFDTHSGNLIKHTSKDSSISNLLKTSYTTFIDRSGLLWIGTSGYGLLKRNIRSENFHHTGTTAEYLIKEVGVDKFIIGNNKVVKYIFDKANNQLLDAKLGDQNGVDVKALSRFLFLPIAVEGDNTWFVEKNMVRVYNQTPKKETRFLFPVINNEEYPDLVQCKIKDSTGNIWMATTRGLLCFNMVERKWSVYKNNVNDSTSLSSDAIFSLCLDPAEPKKYIWVGTRGTGLNRMDMATGKCIQYSIKDGLPNNVVYGILNDDDGNLWLSTNSGLSCFNPQKKTFKNFDHKDGLQSNEFNRGAYCRASDGCLFFGGVSGFNYFYPSEIMNNMTVPKIVITAFKIRNQPVPINSGGSVLTKAIYLTEKVTLPYSENFISLEFASMDYTNSEKNQYQYKLEGFEKNWVNSDNTHSATYTNLDPGTYTFRVRGSNNDGTWNEEGASIQLSILPPWYMTWWFRIAILLALMLAAYSFYRYRLNQALKLQAIRNRIAGDLHDEVGSNLSNIFIFSNIAQQKSNANEQTGPLLQKITDYTQQSMEAMDDIVWMINTRNDRFENIMARMRNLAAEFSEASGCMLHLDFDEELNALHLNMEDRKNFYLIYKEAINNVAKYAECKNAWIEMRLQQKTVTLKIRDDGKGFDQANTKKGNGLVNMKKRSELLRGSLVIESNVGEGTLVSLRFRV